jgi:hypothetical protein
MKKAIYISVSRVKNNINAFPPPRKPNFSVPAQGRIRMPLPLADE